MKIHPAPQGSVDWSIARAGIATCSEFDQLLTPLFKVRTGDMPDSYVNKKLAEAWLGGPLLGFNTFNMDAGKILEEEAIPWYELEFGETIQRVGLITTDDGKVGCSPDGLLGDDGGIEIKCPEPHTHVGYLRDGEVPPQYRAQVHGAMWVTGRKWWKFVSYRRRFPPLVVTVYHDDEIHDAISEALVSFSEAFDAGWARLCELAGGPPKRPVARPVTMPATEPEYVDIIP